VNDLLHTLNETLYQTGEAEGEDWDDPE